MIAAYWCNRCRKIYHETDHDPATLRPCCPECGAEEQFNPTVVPE